MLGMTNHSKVPLRLMTLLGFATACLSLLAGSGYLAYKLVFWNSFSVGVAPLVIGMFSWGRCNCSSWASSGSTLGRFTRRCSIARW